MQRSVAQVAQWILLGLAAIIVRPPRHERGVPRSTSCTVRPSSRARSSPPSASGSSSPTRVSGVINFANGAIAMYCAYFYSLLRREGDILVPPLPNPLVLIEGPVNWFRESGDFIDLPDWPTRISVGPNMQVIPAVLLTLLFGSRVRARPALRDLPAAPCRADAGEGGRVDRSAAAAPGDRGASLRQRCGRPCPSSTTPSRSCGSSPRVSGSRASSCSS